MLISYEAPGKRLILFVADILICKRRGLMQGHLSRAVRIKGVNLCEAITAASGTCQPSPCFFNSFLTDEDT